MNTGAHDTFRYDAFISYSHKDRPWVRGTLLPRLEREGLRICIDYRDFEIGVPSLINMENAVRDSRFQIERLLAAIRSAPQPPPPAKPIPAQSPAPVPDSGFRYERGLVALRERLVQADVETRLAFGVLEARLRENLRDDRLYGTTETIRSDRARIVYELNRLALNHAGPSFDELCGA